MCCFFISTTPIIYNHIGLSVCCFFLLHIFLTICLFWRIWPCICCLRPLPLPLPLLPLSLHLFRPHSELGFNNNTSVWNVCITAPLPRFITRCKPHSPFKFDFLPAVSFFVLSFCFMFCYFLLCFLCVSKECLIMCPNYLFNMFFNQTKKWKWDSITT